jgi:hypothetical protein
MPWSESVYAASQHDFCTLAKASYLALPRSLRGAKGLPGGVQVDLETPPSTMQCLFPLYCKVVHHGSLAGCNSRVQ